MPTYEFRCRACGSTFTVNRPMEASGDPAACPVGHADTVRLLSFAAVGGGSGAAAGSAGSSPGPMGGGGGCCGGGCCGG
ncbi:MAG: zinc ribbon domain-containing protein [Actinomycetales bacterium]|nr:zinc ribbon domain-containing protein [Actinomycetales bacterium]